MLALFKRILINSWRGGIEAAEKGIKFEDTDYARVKEEQRKALDIRINSRSLVCFLYYSIFLVDIQRLTLSVKMYRSTRCNTPYLKEIK